MGRIFPQTKKAADAVPKTDLKKKNSMKKKMSAVRGHRRAPALTTEENELIEMQALALAVQEFQGVPGLARDSFESTFRGGRLAHFMQQVHGRSPYRWSTLAWTALAAHSNMILRYLVSEADDIRKETGKRMLTSHHIQEAINRKPYLYNNLFGNVYANDGRTSMSQLLSNMRGTRLGDVLARREAKRIARRMGAGEQEQNDDDDDGDDEEEASLDDMDEESIEEKQGNVNDDDGDDAKFVDSDEEKMSVEEEEEDEAQKKKKKKTQAVSSPMKKKRGALDRVKGTDDDDDEDDELSSAAKAVKSRRKAMKAAASK